MQQQKIAGNRHNTEIGAVST